MNDTATRPAINTNHPWAILPILIDAGILTPEQARDDIVLAHMNGFRKAFREIEALLPELLQLELIHPKAMEKLRGIVTRAQAESTPDGHQ